MGDKAALTLCFRKLLGVDFVAKPLVLTSSYRLEIKNISQYVRRKIMPTQTAAQTKT